MGNFFCDQCGLCCQNLHLSELYADLDSGDGTCIYFDHQSKLCTIYENRPLKCQVDKMYELYFSSITKDEYYQLNYDACQLLKNNDRTQKKTKK
ncbi:YkgJ family cysteine cluster protein [Lysinibacillus sp. OTC-L20]|uniref:YkgJ family cysteine cluster protein n=1 Tax=Lysinibacillus sp. OTC-L20 TaxID=3342791 RepID=UPI0035B90A9B